MSAHVDELRRKADAAVPAVVAVDKAIQRLAPDGVVLTCGSDLTPKPIDWLWLHWLALGKLHILAGAPGQGKTTLALAAIATLTSGGRWPDGISHSLKVLL